MCDQCGCGQIKKSESKSVYLEKDVLDINRVQAGRIRQKLEERNSRMVNIIGGPGCGKTELLVSVCERLGEKLKAFVIEGDLATRNDAERIARTGTDVYQVETGMACHLSAHDVEHALDHLPLQNHSLVIVENVGNLVCPSLFEIGETKKIVCLSVTEGDDKPEKYPVSFHEADLCVITKSDLLEFVDFDLDKVLELIDQINKGLPVIVTSAKNNEGISTLIDHLLNMWEYLDHNSS